MKNIDTIRNIECYYGNNIEIYISDLCRILPEECYNKCATPTYEKYARIRVLGLMNKISELLSKTISEDQNNTDNTSSAV
jgi:hypothetical protein